MTNKTENYKMVLQFLQRNDRNGDFTEVWEEYKNGELPLEVMHEICETTIKHIIEEDLEENDKNYTIFKSYLDMIV